MAKHMSVLIIEDEVTTRNILRARLEKRDGYRVYMAEDGETGLKLAAAKKPHIILLDWIMPGIDGVETLKHLKSNKNTKDIPVYMLTGKSLMEDVEAAFEEGAKGYFSKPIYPGDLSAKVRKALIDARSARLVKKKSRWAA